MSGYREYLFAIVKMLKVFEDESVGNILSISIYALILLFIHYLMLFVNLELKYFRFHPLFTIIFSSKRINKYYNK